MEATKIDWPVVVQTGGVKTIVIAVLAIITGVALIAVLDWTGLLKIVDKATFSKWDLAGKARMMDAAEAGATRRRNVITFAVCVLVTLLALMFFPRVGQSHLEFQQFVDKYDIVSIQAGERFDSALLDKDGTGFKVDDLKNGVYPVTYRVTGSSMETDGSIMIDNGKARLAGPNGPAALKKGATSF